MHCQQVFSFFLFFLRQDANLGKFFPDGTNMSARQKPVPWTHFRRDPLNIFSKCSAMSGISGSAWRSECNSSPLIAVHSPPPARVSRPTFRQVIFLLRCSTYCNNYTARRFFTCKITGKISEEDCRPWTTNQLTQLLVNQLPFVTIVVHDLTR